MDFCKIQFSIGPGNQENYEGPDRCSKKKSQFAIPIWPFVEIQSYCLH